MGYGPGALMATSLQSIPLIYTLALVIQINRE